MQLINLSFLLAGLMPLAVTAGPVDTGAVIFTRGIDICNRAASAGDVCNHGPGGDEPHICGANDPRAILHCVKGKWTLERKCNAGQHCTCNGGGATGDITCKA